VTTIADRQPISIEVRVMELFALVSEGLAGATGAFLEGDRAAARMLVERDALIDRTYHELEEMVVRQLTQPATAPYAQHVLLCIFRIVPELERSGDLAEHIAQRAGTRLVHELTPRARGLVEQMGRVGVEMWRAVTDAYIDRDGTVAARLTERDAEIDDLHVSLIAEIVSGAMSLPVAIEMALIARFFERLGDHAVNVARRVHEMVDSTPAG
jgi:phosphate transport system protein